MLDEDDTQPPIVAESGEELDPKVLAYFVTHWCNSHKELVTDEVRQLRAVNYAWCHSAEPLLSAHLVSAPVRRLIVFGYACSLHIDPSLFGETLGGDQCVDLTAAYRRAQKHQGGNIIYYGDPSPAVFAGVTSWFRQYASGLSAFVWRHRVPIACGLDLHIRSVAPPGLYAYNAQPGWLMIEPPVTFLRTIYAPHTPFAREARPVQNADATLASAAAIQGTKRTKNDHPPRNGWLRHHPQHGTRTRRR
jgi:hypothetical protein